MKGTENGYPGAEIQNRSTHEYNQQQGIENGYDPDDPEPTADLCSLVLNEIDDLGSEHRTDKYVPSWKFDGELHVKIVDFENAVRLAARIEQLNKRYESRLLVSEAVWQAAQEMNRPGRATRRNSLSPANPFLC